MTDGMATKPDPRDFSHGSWIEPEAGIVTGLIQIYERTAKERDALRKQSAEVSRKMADWNRLQNDHDALACKVERFREIALKFCRERDEARNQVSDLTAQVEQDEETILNIRTRLRLCQKRARFLSDMWIASMKQESS